MKPNYSCAHCCLIPITLQLPAPLVDDQQTEDRVLN
jgi:hypothetical protein